MAHMIKGVGLEATTKMITRKQRKALNRSKLKRKAIAVARSSRTNREKYDAKMLANLAAWGITREDYNEYLQERRTTQLAQQAEFDRLAALATNGFSEPLAVTHAKAHGDV